MKQEQKDEEQLQKDSHPSEPMYNPIEKKEAMPNLTPKMKLALDPNYYLPNYVPDQEEDSTQSLVNNMVPPPDKLEDQEKNNGQYNKDSEEAEEDRRKDSTKTQQDSGQEADEKEDSYSEYSDYDFVY